MGTDLKTKLERIPLEILNQGSYDLIDEIYAPDFVEHYAQPGIPFDTFIDIRSGCSIGDSRPELHRRTLVEQAHR